VCSSQVSAMACMVLDTRDCSCPNLLHCVQGGSARIGRTRKERSGIQQRGGWGNPGGTRSIAAWPSSRRQNGRETCFLMSQRAGLHCTRPSRPCKVHRAIPARFQTNCLRAWTMAGVPGPHKHTCSHAHPSTHAHGQAHMHTG